MIMSRNVFLCLLILLCSCGKDDSYKEVNIELSQQQCEIRTANNSFANKLFLGVNKENENSVISPFGFQVVMSMFANGANDDVRNEVLEKMGLSNHSLNAINEYNKLLYSGLQRGGKKSPNRLKMKNALWLQEGHSVNDPFSEIIKEYYGTGIYKVDFSNRESANSKIFKWIGETDNLNLNIPFDKKTNFIVTDFCSFSGEWKTPFENSNTAQLIFTNEDGSEKSVPTMCDIRRQLYYETDDYQLTELKYKNESYSMLVFLPKEGKKVEDVINSIRWNELEFKNASVDLKMPKFNVTTVNNFVKVMEDAGWEKIFEHKSLQGITDNARLSFFIQNTNIEINEKGATVSSVTIGGDDDLLPEIKEVAMNVNRPFVFAIRENSTGVLLLIGKIAML